MSHSFFDLSEKVVLITGAAGHLGSAICKRLHGAGAKIYINGRSVDKLHSLSKEIDENTSRIEIVEFDISDETARDEALQIIARNEERLDGLVNNAYIPMSGSAEETSLQDFQKSLEVNVSATFALTQKCFPLMEKTDGKPSSSVVNIASIYGMVSPDPSIYGDSGMNNPPFYGAGKSALIQLTRYLACHMADKGIRYNAISPGTFPQDSVKKDMPEFHEELCKKNPLKRVGEPNEVAAAVHFLLSDDASYINGINMPVDGGWTAW